MLRVWFVPVHGPLGGGCVRPSWRSTTGVCGETGLGSTHRAIPVHFGKNLCALEWATLASPMTWNRYAWRSCDSRVQLLSPFAWFRSPSLRMVRPDVSVRYHPDNVTYRARFCHYDADGASHVDLDETFSREEPWPSLGANAAKRRSCSLRAIILQVRTVDVIQVQRDLDRAFEVEREKSGGQDPPAVAPVLWATNCPVEKRPQRAP
jgi:hypothetical protein